MTLLGAPAWAQPNTEDGIRAVLRGDYQGAARILPPRNGDADGLVLQNAGGTSVRVPEPVRLTAIVGSMGG